MTDILKAAYRNRPIKYRVNNATYFSLFLFSLLLWFYHLTHSNRIANTNQLYGMAIYFTNANSLSCTIREIAVDGVYLDAPRTPRLGKTFIAAGARVDLLVNCPAGVFTVSVCVPLFRGQSPASHR